MVDYLEGFGEEIPSGEVLAEEEKEVLARVAGITKEVFTCPRGVKSDHIHYAVEEWTNLRDFLMDAHAGDLIGEVIELLGQILDERSLSFEEAQRGRRMVDTLARFYGTSTGRGALS